MRQCLRQEPLFPSAGALLALHAVLWTVSVLGIAWSRPLVGLLWLMAAGFTAWTAAPHLRAAFEALLRFRQPLPVISCGLGLGAFGAFALASWLGWNVHPDWVFHWGPKAQRFALVQGIDLEFLARPWNAHAHPDYPTLLPNLTASLALALGLSVSPLLGAVVTLLFAALWLAALRALAFRLLGGRGPRWVAEAAWVTAAWSVTMFGTGFRQAAGADLPFACAVTLGALALSASKDELCRRHMAADLRVGIAAAVASQIKFEGTVFALVLVGLWCLRRFVEADPDLQTGRALPTRLSAGLASGLAAGVLPALFVAAWYLWNRQHGLFLPSNAGALDPSRLGVVLKGLFSAASERAWHGLPFTLLALPWLWLRRALRWPALLLTGQLAAYLGVYLTTPVDLDLLLLTSASRLLYHLVPTLLVLLVVAMGSDQPSDASSTSSDEPVSPTFLA